MTLKYKIRFYDYWHLSSGLSAGAKLDSTVTKDKDGIPYVPAKTIKGLLREVALNLDECFGDEGTRQGRCYFANATLDKDIKKEIVSNSLQDNLYDIIASTKIDSNGVAEDKSLRDIEVVIPLTLEGEILDVAQNDIDNLKKAMRSVKRMGLNRNRGLGRCEFIVEDLA